MKLRVTHRGCFGRIDGEVAELPIGHEFVAEEMPAAFNGRVIVIDDSKTAPAGEESLDIATLMSKTVKDLEEFCADNGLGITQENGEKKEGFVHRIKEAYDLKQTQE